MEKKEQEVAEEYLSSLADLNLNSKPLINMLTILAEENIEYASVIVKSVEQHIAKVNPDVKLPVLYLIDSIVKNVGREYIQLFSHCIVNIFCGVFEKVNEKIREKMYTLRQTWNDVFTPQKLYTLDVKVNCMDPNWPITAKVVPKSPAIHVNPNFFKNKAEPLNEMQAKVIRDKQRQILELQKRKLELELARTKQRLEEQEKQLTMQTESVKAINNMPPVAVLQPPAVRAVFNPYKVMPPRQANPINVPPVSMPGSQAMAKTRVAPVNPNMLNSIRYRDPRLARQQQQQQQQQQQSQSHNRNNEVPPATVVSSAKGEQAENEDLKNFTGSQDGKKDGEMEKTKATNMKGFFGSRDKLKTFSSQGEKRSTAKSITEKSNSNSDKSPIRSSSSNSRKINRPVSKGGSVKPYDKEGRSRDKSSNTIDVKKKSSKIDSPVKLTDKLSATKQSEKSPKRSTEAVKSSNSSSPGTKFKDIKHGVKSRNYVRRNREKSRSTSPVKDVDLRALNAAPKRPKLTEKTGGKDEDEKIVEIGEPAPPVISTIPKETKLPDLEQNVEPVSSKDIDLRQFQTNSAKVENNSGVAAARTINSDEDETKSTKRISVDNTDDEPATKKSRQEKIDGLFGSEDVDLRTMNGPVTIPQSVSSPALPMTPPPPPIISNESENWAKVKGTKPTKTAPTPKASLEDVRAKLAKATRSQLPKLDKEKEPRQQTRFTDVNEDSQDGTDANIRTIISQAQELLDTENMNVEQYNTLVKTVIHINETNKLKEAQRRESLRESLLSKSIEKLTGGSLEEEGSKTSQMDDSVERSKEKSKIFGKRIPKLPKDGISDVLPEQSSILQRSSPPLSGSSGSNSYADQRVVNANGKPEKRVRQRESKWSSPWETGHNTATPAAPKSWGASNNHRPNFPPKPPQPVANSARTPIPSPWQNPPPMIFAAPTIQMPSIQMPPIAPISTEAPIPSSMVPVPPSQFGNSVDNPKSDIVRTINIDSVAKEIRIYGEVAVVFMDWDQPREIGFQNGQRRVFIDDQESIVLNFNKAGTTIMVNGNPHKIRFGCPSRELYIDDNWYECCFGGPPLAIPLENKVHVIKIEGPPPQVNIGNLRQDLVIGKINFIVDARIIIPVFVDSTLQTFELDGKKHTLQFADDLKRVLIDNEPVVVTYGDLPRSVTIGGQKRFVRFSTLPNGQEPGKVRIKGMVKTEMYEPEIQSAPPAPVPENVANPIVASATPVSDADLLPQAQAPVPLTPASSPKRADDKKSAPEVTPVLPAVGTLNIDELFQKLLASGILNQTSKTGKQEVASKPKNSDTILPVDLSKPETIKTRQSGIIQKLFCGMQCSSCGVRFPPEQTMKYSQHLDWHFRQNRRERDSSRKAHSRKWYYDVSDWIQYEEIEDLEEREKNWFEAQQTELDVDESSNPRANSPVPSCPAGPDDVDRSCDMCHDKFEQFYSEEFEEWHLRSAIRVEDKIYHPLCYQDYKAALAAEEKAKKAKEEGGEVGENNADDSVTIVKEEKSFKDGEKDSTTISEDDYDEDDDDVMIVNIEESVTEIPDDEEEELKALEENERRSPKARTPDAGEKTEGKKDTESSNDNDKNESMESDVEIQEPHIPFTDLDTYVEQPPQSVSTLDESSQSSQFNPVRIKEEPKDDDDDDAFEDVGTFVSVDDISQSLDEYVPQPVNSTATGGPDNLLASIDGNVEVQDAAAPSVAVNKIKINITKNVVASQKANVSPLDSVSNIPVICNIQETANKPEILLTENKSASPEKEDVSSIDFTFKPELRDVELKAMPKIESGYETSGLCSIM